MGERGQRGVRIRGRGQLGVRIHGLGQLGARIRGRERRASDHPWVGIQHHRRPRSK